MIELTLFVPSYQKDEDLPTPLLTETEKRLGIKTQVKRFTIEDGWNLKMGTMLPVSVSKKIGIKQTRRTKSLYAQLLVYLDGKLFTFYPQSYGEKEISINEFLSGLLRGTIACLHDKQELKEAIAEVRKKGT
jgi:hypothetical protein